MIIRKDYLAMTKFKITKITFAFLVAIQFNNSIQTQSEAFKEVSIDQILLANNEFVKTLEALKKIKQECVEVCEKQFKNTQDYPDMSLADMGDLIIAIISRHEKDLLLPKELIERVKQLIDIKKNVSKPQELKSGHILINEILDLLVDFISASINKESTILKEYIGSNGMVEIRKTLIKYKGQLKRSTKSQTYKTIDNIEEDLKNIGKELAPIFINHPLYEQINNKINNSEVKSASLPEQLKLFAILSHRIAKNKKS